MIPEFNNVYGVVFAPAGLEHVLAAVVRLKCWEVATIRTSGFSGESKIYLESEVAGFESDPLPETSEHLFNGAVGGTLNDAVKCVRELSEALEECEVVHRLEIYDDQRKIAADLDLDGNLTKRR